jgi:tetratricopeptide (TPR) repeat protein
MRSSPLCRATLLLALATPAVAGDPTPPPSPPPADVDSLREQVRTHPDDDELRRRLAIALYGARQVDDAVREFETLVQHKPDDTRALLDLALAYGTDARVDDAVGTYRRLLEVSPGHAIALHNLGNLAYKAGDAAAAIDWYQNAIKSKPDYLFAWYHLGDALKLAERFKEAYRAYEQVLELEPRTPDELEAFNDSLYKLASLDLAMGAVDRARQMLEELLRAAPEHPSAYYAYGQVLLRLGRTEEAQRAFEKHAKIQARRKPTSPMAADE